MEKMGDLKKMETWGPKYPNGDQSPQMGTNVGAVQDIGTSVAIWTILWGRGGGLTQSEFS